MMQRIEIWEEIINSGEEQQAEPVSRRRKRSMQEILEDCLCELDETETEEEDEDDNDNDDSSFLDFERDMSRIEMDHRSSQARCSNLSTSNGHLSWEWGTNSDSSGGSGSRSSSHKEVGGYTRITASERDRAFAVLAIEHDLAASGSGSDSKEGGRSSRDSSRRGS